MDSVEVRMSQFIVIVGLAGMRIGLRGDGAFLSDLVYIVVTGVGISKSRKCSETGI